MNQLANVKILVLISSFSFGLLGTSYGATMSPELGCGLYDLHGTLVINSSGHFILKIQEDSYSPIEILLLGGSYSDKLRRRNTQVKAKVYVPKIITDNNAPIVYLQELLPHDSAKVDRQINSSEKMDCTISGYYKQNP